MHIKPILYAEDEEDDAFFMQRAFQQADIPNPLVIVPDGQSAIDYLSGAGHYAQDNEHVLPCLVLLDLNMPIKSGLDVLKWIRSHPSVCAIPVLFVTSSTQEADIHRAYIMGANSYLVKTAGSDKLLIMVKAIKDYWLAQDRAVQSGINYGASLTSTPPQSS
jgi:CheY-like chemotaxis protein